MKRTGLLIITFFSTLIVFAQKDSIKIDSLKQFYHEALSEIDSMLNENKELDFKKAVFVTENAFLEKHMNYKLFCDEIKRLAIICDARANEDTLNYKREDYSIVAKSAAIFSLMTDTTFYLTKDYILNFPYTYDFEDYNGEKDWTKMFVTKLLVEHKGNCHSLPYLYKILAEEIGAQAYLSFAPNHIYIKNKSKRGMYNTELTNAMMPIDAWIMASGFITVEAIKSGIYMKALDIKESVAVCLYDLAKGYERKFGLNDDGFSLRCLNLALEHYPNFVNAMLAKTEILKDQYAEMSKNEITVDEKIEEIYKELEQLYVHILNLGYREMPPKMYEEWLHSLKENANKYRNNLIIK
jgi:hypothetical protein